MCLEKICFNLQYKKTYSIYNIRKPNFQTITWANSKIFFFFLLCAHQDGFEGELVLEEFVGRGVEVMCQCAPPLQQGFCVTQEQYKSVVNHLQLGEMAKITESAISSLPSF